MATKQINFIRQQGFDAPAAQTCSVQYRALQFQPRLLGILMLAGLILRWPALFLALSAALWWSALLPKWSPFDATYNCLIAVRRGRLRLAPAPGPRRFAQSLAATLMAIVAAALLTGHLLAAGVATAILFAAISGILFGGFCFGSFVFHLLTGNAAFAMQTLPWADGRD